MTGVLQISHTNELIEGLRRREACVSANAVRDSSLCGIEYVALPKIGALLCTAARNVRTSPSHGIGGSNHSPTRRHSI